MAFSQTIAMARDLLADGRADDVVQMVDPLLDPIPDEGTSADAGQVVLHALMARIDVAHRSRIERALDLLAPFDDPSVRADLDDAVRAEVALWLGWAHALRNVQPDEEARALSLLDEAQQLFEETHGLRGRCWALIGRAQAYFAIDEYHLMRQALGEAEALLSHTRDVQAEIWLHDLSVPARRFEGRYRTAQDHVDRLVDHADTHDDRRIRGHAWAHRAALRYDRGSDPSDVIDAAETAVSLLRRLDGDAAYPLLAAYHAHVGARLRQGAWSRAETLIDEAEEAVDAYAAGQAHLQTLRARLAMRQKEWDRAESLLERLVEQVHHLPHGLHRSHVALLRGELLAHRDDGADAAAWMQRALRNARETGHRGHQLRALLALARTEVRRGRMDAADRHLAAVDAYDDYFGVLPYAMLRFTVLGDRAEAKGSAADAQAHYEQALSAASLIGDTHRAGEIQASLRAVVDAPSSPAPGTITEEKLHTTLSRASVSGTLVAEAWMQAVESLLSPSWIGIYRGADDDWSCVHEHGTPPDPLPRPVADAEHAQAGTVRWLRLHEDEGRPFFMGVSLQEDGTRWDEVRPRLRAWRPVLQLALDNARLRQKKTRTAERSSFPRPPAIPLDGFVAESSAMQALARQIEGLRASHSPVLVRGERGTGTTLVARTVHVTSERSDGPCERVSCASMQQSPMRERLFGRVDEGVLTPGALQAADGGTLILEDVDALSPPLQSTLVEVLEDGSVFPVGSSAPVPVDVRFIATTNVDLKTHVESDDFREDLYYHLNVIPLRVPPLRERREDLPLLVRHFLDTLRPTGTSMASVTTRALDAMLEYDWPGNVRQLRNEIERALLYVGSEPAPTIDVGLLSDKIANAEAETPRSTPGEVDAIFRSDEQLSDVLARTEAAVIERVLRACNGQVTASAEVLGLTRQGLYKKMKRLDIDPSSLDSDRSTVAAP